MKKTKILTVMVLFGILFTLIGACTSEPATDPTTSTPEKPVIQNAVEARDSVIEYLQTMNADMPGPDADWQETDTTTPGLVGGVQKEFNTDEWTMVVGYNVVRPDEVIYHIILSNTKLNLYWEGQVKADGTIDETTPITEMSESESKEVAENFVKNSPTFKFDGTAETLTLVDTLTARCPYYWVFVFEFDSAHAGYGDREGQMVAQVITPHQASIIVEQMKITSATMDGTWDMIRQQIISNQPGEQEDALSIAELLANPVYDTAVTVHGEVSLLGELLCPCFELSSGGKKIHVWYGLMVENDGTERPEVEVTGINNGDTIVVTGELKDENGTHYSKDDFWAQAIVLPLQPGPMPESISATCDEFMVNQVISKEIEISAGQVFGVTLCSNPSTGFQWIEEAQISDPDIIKKIGHDFVSPESDPPPPPGTPGHEIWTFEALSKGSVTITMEYSRPWEGGEKSEWTFILNVTVK